MPLKKLAIFAPFIGLKQHHYLKSHIDHLLPGRTVVLTVAQVQGDPPVWSVDCPVLAAMPPLAESSLPPMNFENETPYSALPGDSLDRFCSAPHQDRIADFLLRHEVGVILCQWMNDRLPLVELARELSLPHFTQVHGTDISAGLGDAGVRKKYRGYNTTAGVVAPSAFGRQQLLNLGIRPDKAFSIYHGVEIAEAPPQKSAGRPVRCLVAGRMEAMKAPLVAIRAFHEALSTCPELELHWAGDGSLFDEVSDYVRKHGLDSRVRLHGMLEHGRMLRLMARCHVMLHASASRAGSHRFDTCPVTVVEAMGQGVPVVATRHGGLAEEIEDGVQGFLVDEGDIAALADRLAYLASHPQVREDMGMAAWNKAGRQFSIDGMQRQWRQLLGVQGVSL
jgi:glycosyltransferase involved in cell wall biosynthesis